MSNSLWVPSEARTLECFFISKMFYSTYTLWLVNSSDCSSKYFCYKAPFSKFMTKLKNHKVILPETVLSSRHATKAPTNIGRVSNTNKTWSSIWSPKIIISFQMSENLRELPTQNMLVLLIFKTCDSEIKIWDEDSRTDQSGRIHKASALRCELSWKSCGTIRAFT